MTAVEVGARSRAERPLDERPPRRRGRRNDRLLGIAEHSVAIVLRSVFLAPIVLIILTAFMSSTARRSPRTCGRTSWHWANFAEVFVRGPAPARGWGTRSLYAVLATVFMLLSSFPAAYALAQSAVARAQRCPPGGRSP